MNYLPLVIIAIVLFAVMGLSRRTRQRAVQQQADEQKRIGFGTDVMTTSGLYGTVVGVNDDDTVQLAIAPGVEVKWAVAALRDVASLPGKAGKPGSEPPTGSEPDDSSESSEPPGS